MKEEEKFDQWLRETMDDYKPVTSELSRQRFLSSLPAPEAKGFQWRWIYNVIAVILLALLGFLMYDNSDDFEITRSTKSAENEKRSTAIDNIVTKPVNTKEHNISGKRVSLSITNNSLPHNQLNISTNSVKHLSEPETKVSETTAFTDQPDIISHTNHEEPLPEDSLSDTIVSLVINSDPQESEGIGKKKPDSYMLQNRYLGISYRPGFMWNIIEHEKFVHSIGIEWQSRFFGGNYVLGTGIGVSRTKGYYEYAINYNEFLGSYQRLDSISFNWNPREFTMQQTYYTSPQSVHDTAVKTNYSKLQRDFVYLQLPLIMGYDFVRQKEYSIGIRFSPILSVLMSKKPVEFVYDAGLDKVVQINRITPDRVSTNWQLTTGINLSRRITDNLQIEIEPGFTYYFNSVYEKPQVSSRPYGASVRIAIGFIY